ncbi:hypothetical protein CYMTET_24713 [Cymbomonas tetramitiformis]|uniref:Uncharacterized protein n=1 Tax=Cymbomonas tetramitiformis TaxID=36881 RepID=A0AAE0FVR4_9CHLO|nr:hypothetical protein CYMTET_24713 [Cymbomonas tetramitiformis]
MLALRQSCSLLPMVARTGQQHVSRCCFQTGIVSSTFPILGSQVTVVKSVEKSVTMAVGACLSALGQAEKLHEAAGDEALPRVHFAVASTADAMDLLWMGLQCARTTQNALGCTASAAFPFEGESGLQACAVVAVTLPAGTRLSTFRLLTPQLPPLPDVRAALSSAPHFLMIAPQGSFEAEGAKTFSDWASCHSQLGLGFQHATACSDWASCQTLLGLGFQHATASSDWASSMPNPSRTGLPACHSLLGLGFMPNPSRTGLPAY